MAYKNIISPLGTSSFDSASLTASFQVVNSTAFPSSIYILRIYNASDVPVSVSFDGTNTDDVVPASTLFEIDGFPIGAMQPGAMLPALLQVYVKGTAGTGLIYVSAYTLAG